MIGVLFFLAVPLLVLAADGSGDSTIIGEILKHSMSCASEMKINFGVCTELFDDKTDHSQDKFKDCKCMIPCVAKKMKVMSEEGNFQPDEIQKILDNLQTAKYKEEATRVWPLCKDVKGVNCEGGYNMFECVMHNSPMAKEVVMKLVQILKGKS